jgi:hypothetical protein
MHYLIDIPLQAPYNKSPKLHSRIVFTQKTNRNFGYIKKLIARKRKLVAFSCKVYFSIIKFTSSFEKVYPMKL